MREISWRFTLLAKRVPLDQVPLRLESVNLFCSMLDVTHCLVGQVVNLINDSPRVEGNKITVDLRTDHPVQCGIRLAAMASPLRNCESICFLLHVKVRFFFISFLMSCRSSLLTLQSYYISHTLERFINLLQFHKCGSTWYQALYPACGCYT